jgi:hypothetical protein
MLVIWPAIGKGVCTVKNATGNYTKLNRRNQRKNNHGRKMSVESANYVNMRSIHTEKIYRLLLLFASVNKVYEERREA